MIQFEELVDSIFTLKQEQGSAFVGISGLGGSGKTTLSKKFEAAIPEARIIHVDDFYKTPEERGGIHNSNEIISNCFDWNRLETVVAKVKEGCGLCYRKYNWDKDILDEWVELSAKSITILEGVYALQSRFLPHYDISIWVETPREVRFERGIKRDGEGKRELWENIWMTQDDRYFSAERPDQKAQIIFSGV